MSGTGTGAMICAHCAKPMFSRVCIGGRSYHLECAQAPISAPIITEQRVRELVLESLVKFGVVVKRGPMD